MTFLEALSKMHAMPIPTALTAVDSSVLQYLHDPVPGTTQKLIDLWRDKLCGVSIHLNWAESEPHKIQRFAGYTGPWFATWSPKYGDDAPAQDVDDTLSSQPDYVFIDAEHIREDDDHDELDVTDELSRIANDAAYFWPEASVVYWGHWSWHRTAAGKWQRYRGVPMHPPYAASPALYDTDVKHLAHKLAETLRLAREFGKKTVPYVAFRSEGHARLLGGMLAMYQDDIPACCIYRESTRPIDGDWSLWLTAFSEGYDRAFKRTEKA
jgi:hypothetical protein